VWSDLIVGARAVLAALAIITVPTDRTDLTDLTDLTDRTDLTDLTDRTDRTDLTDLTDRTDRTDLTDLTDPTVLTVQQPARAGGRVVRLVRGDTVPIALVPVVLHRIARSEQGPIDTVRADARGRFQARFTSDTTVLYLLSVRYQGIEYFSAPLRGNPGEPDTALVLIVADTSSTAPVGVSERTLLISGPDEGGSRAVLDWLVLINRGERTRVVPDSQRPTWGAPLPDGVQAVELADVYLSQFSPDAVSFRGDSVMVFAPISPGRKELVLQYRIPGSLHRLLAPAAGTDSVFVLLEEPDARVEHPRLRRGVAQQMQGRSFARWAGVLGDDSRIEVVLPSPGIGPRTVLPILLAVTLLGFGILAGMLLRRRSTRVALPDPVALADAIARLDDRFAQLDPVDEEARARYEDERARLKALLVRALAASPHRS
jgi:hypothetical protein